MSAAPESTAPRFPDDLIAKARQRARARLASVKARYPKESRRQHAERVVRSTSRLGGLGGAATGALSLVALPVGLPAGVAISLTLEAEMLLALMELYGVETTGDAGHLKLLALWAGGGFADAAKSVGLKLGADALGRILAGSLPVRLIQRLNPVLVRFVLKRLGLGWIPKAAKFWPVLGAPIGYVIDSATFRALGRASIATLEAMPAPGTVIDGTVVEGDAA